MLIGHLPATVGIDGLPYPIAYRPCKLLPTVLPPRPGQLQHDRHPPLPPVRMIRNTSAAIPSTATSAVIDSADISPPYRRLNAPARNKKYSSVRILVIVAATYVSAAAFNTRRTSGASSSSTRPVDNKSRFA